MTDWADNFTRATTLQKTVQDDSTALAAVIEELLELAHTDEWIVQRTAIDALGVGLQSQPETGVSKLSALVRTTLDSSIPYLTQWCEGLTAIANVAPEKTREAILQGLKDQAGQYDEAGAATLTRILKRIFLDAPSGFLDSLRRLQYLYQELPADARTHILQMHLGLAETHCDAVWPMLSNLLIEFESGNSDSRLVAADLLCALVRNSDDGSTVVEHLVRWSASQPRESRTQRPWSIPASQ